MNNGEPNKVTEIKQARTGQRKDRMAMNNKAADPCPELSKVMRRSLCMYDLTESELRLAEWLVCDSYDEGKVVGRVDFVLWAKVLGIKDSSGPRSTKCRAMFESLESLRLLNWNRVGAEAVAAGPDGTYELLPHGDNWSKLRPWRSLPDLKPSDTPELPICVKRELDESLSSTSRTNAVPDGPSPDHLAKHRQTQGRSVPWDRLKAALADPSEMAQLLSEFPADYSAGTGKIIRTGPADYSAGAKNAAQTLAGQGFVTSADYSAGTPIASLAPVQRAKLAIEGGTGGRPAPAEKSAERAASAVAALEWLGSVDRAGTLVGRFGPEYEQLCQRHAAYVLGRLRSCFEEHERCYKRHGGSDYQIGDPVGWMGKKAAEEGRMKWHSRRAR